MRAIYMIFYGLIIIGILGACSKDESLLKDNSKAEEVQVYDDHEGHDHDEDEGHEHDVELDYKKLDEAIAHVLKEIPSFSIQKEVEKGTEGNLLDYFNEDKMEFRLKVESYIGNQEYNNQEIQAYAQLYLKEDLMAIEIARNKYNIEVSQSEVAQYINDNIQGITPEEKEQYAKSIGVTLEELDNIFDRDRYIMDVLWTKLTPILMEKYPQKEGESEMEYQERLANEFYNV